MAVNTAHHNGGVLIFNGECILLYCDHVELKFEESRNDPRFKGCKKGRIFLTTHRLIFNTCDCNDPMKSLTFPFFLLSNVGLEQPTFGCNYIKGKIKSQPNIIDLHNDAWIGCAKFKIYFKSGGAIDFGMALLQAAKMASQNANREPPPPYVPPIEPYFQPAHNMYMPPQGSYGMVLPTHVFPDYPPCNSVFMADQPPPYPGINTSPPTPYGPVPPPTYHINAPHVPPICRAPPPPVCQPPCQPSVPYSTNLCAGAERSPNAMAKANEAAASAQAAYYDPGNPHLAYMPNAPPYPYSQQQQPPSYDEATKKTQ